MTTKKRKGKYKEAVYYSPQYKMGVKVLDETQMENIFPSYENLVKRIEEHRSHVWMYDRKKGNLDEQYNLMFDNVFSVMGKRGSGKTSVVYTLKKIFEDKKETDVVLPIVMSELIPESSEIIGWILSLLENTVRNISTKLESEKNRDGLFKDCMVKTGDTLEERYSEVKELCFSRSYVGASEDSFSRIVANSERKTQNSFDFTHRLAEFWTDLREGICVANHLEDKEQPLIYIIFDDVDLAPEKVWELLSTIVKYLSHPNVVVLVTADEEMLYEVVKNILYSKVKKGEMPQERKVSPSWFEEMAKLYVDKILPPSTRYYIENFESCGRKASFVAQLEFDENGEIKRQIRLKEFLEEQVNEYLKFIGKKDTESNFLYYGNKFLEVYLLYWGDTSRQLGNECLITEQLINNLKSLCKKYGSGKKRGNRDAFFDELYHIIYYFVFSTLNANSNAVLTSQEIKTLTDELVLFQPDDWGIYINYRYLQDRFTYEFGSRNGIQKEGTEEIAQNTDKVFGLLRYVKENIMLYLLLFFVENLLIETEAWFDSGNEKRRMRVHGRHNLVAMLDTITPQDYSLVRYDAESGRMREFLYEYGKILENPELINHFDMMSESRVRKYFDSLPEDIDAKKQAYDYCIKNPNWFRTMIKASYLKRTRIYSVTKMMLVGPSMDRIKKIHDRGIEYLDREEIDLMCSYLENVWQLESEKKIGEIIYFELDKERMLADEWRECNTIMELKSYVEKNVGPDISIFEGVQAYFSLLCNMSKGKYQEFFESVHGVGISSRINSVSSEIMNFMNGFTRYKIKDKQEYDGCIKEIEMIADMWYNGREWTSNSNTLVDVEYVNGLLRAIMVKSLSEDGNYWYGRHEQLNSCYFRLKGQLELPLLTEKEKENALYLVLLKKLRMYMKCFELSVFFYKQKEQGTKINYPGREKLPYDGFYERIMQVSGKSKEKDQNPEENAIYIKELITGYIRESVKQYIGNLLGEDI